MMAEARCICTDTINPTCPRCRHYAQLAGIALAPAPKPKLPSLQTQYPEEAAIQVLWQAAEAQGWTPDMHWFPKAPYAGLWCEFIRGTDVLRVLVHRSETTLTRDQRTWLATLRATGKFETYVCEVERLETVLTRLQREAS